MTEFDQFEVLKHSADTISKGITRWLRAELLTSSRDVSVNHYLDDFVNFQNGLRLGYDSPNNVGAQKNQSHVKRLDRAGGSFWEAFIQNPRDDTLSARLLFAPLMLTSGYFRTQCALQASDADDYIRRRLLSPDVAGIDITSAATARLHQRMGLSADFSNASISLEELDTSRQSAVQSGLEAYQLMCARCEAGHDFAQEQSPSVDAMVMGQHAWISFAVDCITYAAKLRGGYLASVPCLEAKSITENPQVVYPFAT